MPPVNRQPARRRRPAKVAGSRGPGVDRGSQADVDAPDTTAPDTAAPGTTAPDATGPDTTAQATAAPDTGTGDPDATVVLTKAGAAAKKGRSGARRTATAPDAPVRGTTAEPAQTPATRASSEPAPAAGRSRPLLATLALAAVLLVAALVVGVLAYTRDGGTTQDAPTANVALVDPVATAEASAATVTILQTAYSYTWSSIDADLDNAVALMTPEMANQHRAGFASIRQVVTDSQTTTKATVVSNGVKLLDGDRAEVIAFVTVGGDNAGTALQTAGYRFTANLLRVDGRWLLSGLAES